MVKTVISRKQEKSSKNTKKSSATKKPELIPYNPVAELLDEQFIGKALLECLKNNDPEGVIEVIKSYLEVANMQQVARHAHIARSTLYNSLKQKNPTLKTLAKIVHASTMKSK